MTEEPTLQQIKRPPTVIKTPSHHGSYVFMLCYCFKQQDLEFKLHIMVKHRSSSVEFSQIAMVGL